MKLNIISLLLACHAIDVYAKLSNENVQDKVANAVGDAKDTVTSFVYDQWTNADVEAFLKDNGITYDAEKASQDAAYLKSIVAENWAKPSPWYAHIKESLASLLDIDTFSDYDLKQALSSSTENIGDWFFDTWSAKDLKNLLSKTGVKAKKNMSRDQLVSLAKENFNAINSKLDVSGYYPSSSYFQWWDEADLQAWLQEFGVTSKSSSKEDLLDAVRKNFYKASQYAEEEREAFLDKIDVANGDFFDKAGELKDGLFQAWSSEDLISWLKSHKVKLEQRALDDKEYLLGLAQKHKSYFKDDLNWFVEKAKKKASPFIGKAGDAKDAAQDAINDTFDLDNWSKDRLKSFLDSRGIGYPLFVSKKQLTKLAEKHIDAPVKNIGETLFKGWSVDNVNQWLVAQKVDISSAISDSELYALAGKTYSDVLARASAAGNVVAEKLQHHGKKAAQAAQSQGAEYAQAAMSAGADYAEQVKSVGADYAEQAMSAGAEYADRAKSAGAEYAEQAMSAGAEYADQAKSAGAEYADEAISMGFDYGGYMAQYAEEFAQQGSDFAQKKAASAYESFKSLGEEAASSASASVASQASMVASVVNDAALQATNAAMVKAGEARSAAEDFTEEQLELAREFYSHQAPLVKKYMVEMYKQARAVGDEGMARVPVVVNKAKDKAKKSAGKIAKKVSNKAKAAGSKAATQAKRAAVQAAADAQQAAADAAANVQQAGADAANYVNNVVAGSYDSLKNWDVFNTWSDADLVAYLKSFGLKPNAKSTREELISRAQANTKWLFGSTMKVKKPWYKQIPEDTVSWVKQSIGNYLN